MTALHVTAAASPLDFPELWPRLDFQGASTAFVFQTAELLDLWRRTIGKARGVAPLFLRIAEPSGEPLMLLALGVERRSGGVRVLTFLDGGVSDYNAPVLLANLTRLRNLPPALLWEAVANAVPSFDVASLEKMPSHVLGLNNPICQWARSPSAPSAHVIGLAGTWNDFVKTRLHRAKDSRRKLRRLEEHGTVRFVVAKTSAAVERLLPVLIAQKTRRYLELNNSDGFERPGYRDYYRLATGELFDRGVLHLSALEVGDDVIATHWGLVWSKRFYSLVLAFADHPLAAYSPGRLLIEHLVEWSFANGLRAFDLGVGDMAWKQAFAPQRIPLFHLTMCASPLGWTYLEARQVRDALRTRTKGGASPKAA